MALAKVIVFAVCVFPLCFAAKCEGGSCEAPTDATSLMQVKKDVKEGTARAGEQTHAEDKGEDDEAEDDEAEDVESEDFDEEEAKNILINDDKMFGCSNVCIKCPNFRSEEVKDLLDENGEPIFINRTRASIFMGRKVEPLVDKVKNKMFKKSKKAYEAAQALYKKYADEDARKAITSENNQKQFRTEMAKLGWNIGKKQVANMGQVLTTGDITSSVITFVGLAADVSVPGLSLGVKGISTAAYWLNAASNGCTDKKYSFCAPDPLKEYGPPGMDLDLGAYEYIMAATNQLGDKGKRTLERMRDAAVADQAKGKNAGQETQEDLDKDSEANAKGKMLKRQNAVKPDEHVNLLAERIEKDAPTYYCSRSNKAWCKVTKATWRDDKDNWKLKYDCKDKKMKVKTSDGIRLSREADEPTTACPPPPLVDEHSFDETLVHPEDRAWMGILACEKSFQFLNGLSTLTAREKDAPYTDRCMRFLCESWDTEESPTFEKVGEANSCCADVD